MRKELLSHSSFTNLTYLSGDQSSQKLNVDLALNKISNLAIQCNLDNSSNVSKKLI